MTLIRSSLIASALLLVLPGAALAAGEEAAPAAAPAAPAVSAPSISVVPAARREIAARATVTGTLVPRETVSVGPDIDGLRVEALLADEGDTVEAGQVLARLATDTIEVSLAQSDSKLARAAAGIAQAGALVTEAESASVEADAALARTRALTAKGIAGQEVLDQRVSAAGGAKARLASARQGVELALADRAAAEAERRELELRLSKTEIRAPTAGLILKRDARLGQVASSAGGAFFEISRDGLVELDAEVSETALGALAKDQSVAVTPAGAAPIEGRVRLVSPRIDETTRLGRVRVALPPSETLRAGAFARGSVEIATSRGVTVPRTAVVTGEDGSTVQVVKDGLVETRKVALGLADDERVEIARGVSEGESVVARAGTFVREGDRVTPVEMPGEGEARTAEAAR